MWVEHELLRRALVEVLVAARRVVERPATVLNALMEVTRAGGAVGIPGLYVTGDPGGVDENAKIGNLGIRIGLGWAKSHTFTTGQCPVMRYHRQLMQAILHEKAHPAKATNVTYISLDEAPTGYRDFDKGAAKKFVMDPHGMAGGHRRPARHIQEEIQMMSFGKPIHMRCGAIVLGVVLTAGLGLADDDDDDENGGPNCAGLPDHAALTAALKVSVAPTGGPANGGFDLHMWATVVNRDGQVCAVTFSGDDRGEQWPGSRVISAQKANTANAFSLPDTAPIAGLSLSTANLWAATQPGGSLFGLQFSNPVDTAVAYGGPSSHRGKPTHLVVRSSLRECRGTPTSAFDTAS